MPIRVLEVINESSLGGGQSQLLSLAAGLPGDRFQVEIAAGGGGPLVDRARELGLPFFELPFTGSTPWALAGAIRRRLAQGCYSLVHTHGGIAGFWVRTAALGLGVRTVHTLHGIHYLHYENPVKRLAYVTVDRFLAGFTDRVVCVCRSDADRAVAAGVARQGQVRVVHNGIEPPAPGAPDDRATTRAGFGVDDSELLVGCVARLHLQKGLPFLIDAMALLRDRPLRLVIAGDGELKSALAARISAQGLAGRVLMLGAITDAARFYRAIDLFCLPSLWEGLPLSILEALTHALPVVATAVDGSVEVVEDGVHGLLVPPRDPAALATALAALQGDPKSARALGQAGRDRVSAEFTRERMVEKTASVYDELVATSGPVATSGRAV